MATGNSKPKYWVLIGEVPKIDAVQRIADLNGITGQMEVRQLGESEIEEIGSTTPIHMFDDQKSAESELSKLRAKALNRKTQIARAKLKVKRDRAAYASRYPDRAAQLEFMEQQARGGKQAAKAAE